LLWSRWETRVQDYAEFCKETGRVPEKSGFPQTGDHPVVNVSFEDAVVFCEWLSKREGGRYRLPTDHEWSVAVGIGDREDAKATPASKHGKIAGVYPWGGEWPPTAKSGNYAADTVVGDRRRTSPVGKYAPTADGLYDLGGNVLEWCDTGFRPGVKSKVLRGGSWLADVSANLLSSSRGYSEPENGYANIGFRVVRELGAEGR